MSRSIHTTKRALIRERKFALNDGVAHDGSMTQLERDDIQKTIHKTNATWKHQAEKQQTPAHAELLLDETQPERKIVRRIRRRKTKNDT